MSGLDAGRFAELLAGYCLDVQPGQQVLVRSSTLAAPLLLELQRAILEREAWPLLRVELPGQAEAFHAHAREAQLDGFAPLALTEAEGAGAALTIAAPENTRALSGVDPQRLARTQRARRRLQEARLRRRWAITLWPTQAGAQERARASRTSRRSSPARSSSSAPTPSRRGASCRRSRPGSSSAWPRRASCASRPRAPT